MHATLLNLLPGNHLTAMRKVALTRGGEWQGPCPFCGGKDRFRIQPHHGETGFFRCRQCEASGDGVQFLRDFYGYSFEEACAALGKDPGPYTSNASTTAHQRPTPKAKPMMNQAKLQPAPKPPQPTRPPSERWQHRAREIAEAAEARLWSTEGEAALAYLRSRALSDAVIRVASLGFNPTDIHDDPEVWGLDASEREGKPVWTPRGITIPWVHDEALWRLNVRRSSSDLAEGGPKYIGPAGSSNGLYESDRIQHRKPVVLVEGEFDALSILQVAHDIASPVATGSTTGSRRPRWLSRLALASVVLVAYDNEPEGDKAAKYWTESLPNARRWPPYWGDANQLLKDGADVRAWIEAGLSAEPELIEA